VPPQKATGSADAVMPVAPHNLNEFHKKKKEAPRPSTKIKIKVSAIRAMTEEEERRFTATADALLSEIVRQELCNQKGEDHEQ
jgi:hypothetical protein